MSQIITADIDSTTGIVWEWRVFWPPDSSSLKPLFDFAAIPGEAACDIVVEKDIDTYILIPRSRINLKQRKDRVAFKIVSSRKGMLNGYSKKKSRTFPMSSEVFTLLTGIQTTEGVNSPEQFRETIVQHRPDAKILTIEKDKKTMDFRGALNAKGEYKTLRVEHSSLKFGKRSYGTLCLESKSTRDLLDTIRYIDIGNGKIMDYIDFLSLLASGKI